MIEDYEKAKKRGERAVRRAGAEGKYPYLPALDAWLEGLPPLSEEVIGLTEIPLSMIVGTKTVGRQNAFAYNFMPILAPKSEFAIKWSSLYESQLEEGIREPIKVYEYMRRFYVQEGNKRVSVLNFVEASSINAEVVRILPPRTEDRESRLYYEFVEFYRAAPMYEISFSRPGSYRKFAGKLGQDLKTPWPEELLANVKSAYTFFEAAFRKKFREDVSVGDALLVYLDFYPLESIFSESQASLQSRIERLRKEILTERNENSVNLVEDEKQLPEQEESGGLFGILRRTPVYTRENPFRAAFLYDRSPEESSWIYGHELGRNALSDLFEGRVEAVRFDGCDTDAKIRRAIDAAAADQAQMVFTTSQAQMGETLRSAIHYPKMHFLNCSVNLPHHAVRTYFGRMYEAKFLMGALAASLTRTHRIAYCADFPIYGTIAEINAFAIGASLTDPCVRIELHWTGEKTGGWNAEQLSKGVDVLSGPDLIRPNDASRKYGLYRVQEDGSIRNLAVPVCNWGRYYELLIRSCLEGSWNADPLVREDQGLNYWLGISSGVIDVILSRTLSYSSRKLADMLKSSLAAGTLHPFEGELHSQDGIIRTAGDPGLTNEEIITMNWLYENVEGRIPSEKELIPEAIKLMRMSGVQAETVGSEEETI
ncbi:MAG: BMP family ABC transporter substrate-binding protein [Lachnospiraceae bacterium]|nr:BMP family ABC transporter substrate-binding protein [Lachnospiraceae bacterium]